MPNILKAILFSASLSALLAGCATSNTNEDTVAYQEPEPVTGSNLPTKKKNKNNVVTMAPEDAIERRSWSIENPKAGR